MTSMEHENQETLQQYIQTRTEWLAEAAVVIGIEPGASLQELQAALPEPTEVRRESERMTLSSEQEVSLREIAGRFGIGGEQDVLATAEHQIIEGGLAWKVAAEVAIASSARTMVFAGSPNRSITREDERTFMQNIIGEDAEIGMTEYDIVRQIASAQSGFEPLEQEETLPFGYSISDNFEVTGEPTGQLVRIGSIDGRDILLLRVDRENYVDEVGDNKYRNQPDGAAIMGIVADVLTANGDEESAVGLVTSNTYSSRAIDVKRAGHQKGRVFQVGMYGRQTLADVKGEPIAESTEINQIPGELHVIASKLAKLQEETAEA